MEARSPALSVVRASLLGILVLGLAGTLVELLLLRHTEGFWELVPISLLGGSLLVVGWDALARSVLSRRLLQLTMILFVLSGAVGTYLHFDANALYERESNPGAPSGEIYRLAVMGSTPTLAPGTMVLLGLVGLLFAFIQVQPTTNRGA